MSAQVLSWALMVVCIWIKFTLDPSGHLSVHWVLGVQGLMAAISFQPSRGWWCRDMWNHKVLLFFFEFGSPQTFVKGIPVNPSCCITLPSWRSSRVLRRVSREAAHVHHAWMEKRKMAARPAGVHECPNSSLCRGLIYDPPLGKQAPSPSLPIKNMHKFGYH